VSTTASTSTPPRACPRLVGALQRVEILRALPGADILILDEPTAVLTPQEAGPVPRHPRPRERRKTTIFISHKLEEVLEIRRRSPCSATAASPASRGRASDTRQLAQLMVGREVFLEFSGPRRVSAIRPLSCVACPPPASAT
jgi:simple sugar transport system ATP-binding protein